MNSVHHQPAPNKQKNPTPALPLPSPPPLLETFSSRIRQHLKTATARIKNRLRGMNVAFRQEPGRGDALVNAPRPRSAMVIDLVSDDEDPDFDDDGSGDDDDEEVGDDGGHGAPRYMGDVVALNAYIPPDDFPMLQQSPSPDPFAEPQLWDDYLWENPFDEADQLAQVARKDNILYEHHAQAQQHALPRPAVPPMGPEQVPQPVPEIDTRKVCVDAILVIFPDICRDHVSELYNTISESSDQLIAHILDRMDNGNPYPKAKDLKKNLKRKREVDEDEAMVSKYGAADRAPVVQGPLRGLTRNLLSQEFSTTPMAFIDATLAQSQYRLFHAYGILEEAHRMFDPTNPPYNKIKKPRNLHPKFAAEDMRGPVESKMGDHNQRMEVLRELQTARGVREKSDQKRQAIRQAELEEEANIQKAQEEGTMSECGCCFGDFPLNRMVHCDGDTLHWFCRACARQTAETEIGNSKYELHCMSMDGCEAGFGVDQRALFLDEKTITALERNEQEAMLRMAGIENLASCPFCPFAAEYPPVEVNKEFQCQNPDCEKVSCRLCRLESHIPKSCEENAKDNGLSVRRQIEEAMSAALIRKCNKCGTPFVKEEGCNKMTCTRNGCRNVQCYVCSKSCSYDHFNEPSRGGKSGNCPLFESVEERHGEEVRKAEREALEKVRAEHPEYTEEDLKIKVSENVLKDEVRRKAADPRMRMFPAQPDRVNGHRHILPQFYGAHPMALPANGPARQELNKYPQADYLGGYPLLDFANDYHGGMYALQADGSFMSFPKPPAQFAPAWSLNQPAPIQAPGQNAGENYIAARPYLFGERDQAHGLALGAIEHLNVAMAAEPLLNAEFPPRRPDWAPRPPIAQHLIGRPPDPHRGEAQQQSLQDARLRRQELQSRVEQMVNNAPNTQTNTENRRRLEARAELVAKNLRQIEAQADFDAKNLLRLVDDVDQMNYNVPKAHINAVHLRKIEARADRDANNPRQLELKAERDAEDQVWLEGRRWGLQRQQQALHGEELRMASKTR